MSKIRPSAWLTLSFFCFLATLTPVFTPLAMSIQPMLVEFLRMTNLFSLAGILISFVAVVASSCKRLCRR